MKNRNLVAIMMLGCATLLNLGCGVPPPTDANKQAVTGTVHVRDGVVFQPGQVQPYLSWDDVAGSRAMFPREVTVFNGAPTLWGPNVYTSPPAASASRFYLQTRVWTSGGAPLNELVPDLTTLAVAVVGGIGSEEELPPIESYKGPSPMRLNHYDGGTAVSTAFSVGLLPPGTAAELHTTLQLHTSFKVTPAGQLNLALVITSCPLENEEPLCGVNYDQDTVDVSAAWSAPTL